MNINNVCLVLLFALMTSYAVFTFHEINIHDEYPDYYDNVVPYIMSCELDEIPSRNGETTRSPIKWYMVCLSYHVFGNENVIPALFSILLIPATFQLGSQLGSSRITGLVSAMVLVSSPMFNRWDTSATYDQIWTFFLVLSMILITHPKVSPAVYVLSVLAKGLSLLYAPMIFYQYVKNVKDKRLVSILLAMFIISGIIISVTGFGGSIEFDGEEFVKGFYIWYFYFGDPLVMGFPVVVLLLISLRKNIKNYDVVVFWIIGIILTTPLILGFTNQLIHPYRFVPFTIFYGIGIGMIIKFYLEKKKWLRIESY